MRANYTLARLYVPDSLQSGQSLSLPKDQSHYLATVMRKQVGDDIRLFNGQDGEFRGQLTDVTRKSVGVAIKEQLRAAHTSPDIWLCFAPVRKDRTAFIIEKACELGARKIMPVITTRTQFPKMRLERMRAQIIEAAEQTERLDLPDLDAPVKLKAMQKSWDKARSLYFADEAGAAEAAGAAGEAGAVMPARQALSAPKTYGQPAAILIGPQGGFDPAERELLRQQSYVTPVSLGPRILRSDTAAISLLSLWQSQCGDWR